MAEIRLLDNSTIDKIAAGEVVERPASVVKELVENALDAGADAVTVEIRDGGCSFLRVTDNGGGIEKDQVRKAFFRHATSKIGSAEDLFHIRSLGFRGEALSSIAAVSMVELITKTKEQVTGIHYCLEGEAEKDFSEVGAPDGTTFIVRELFFNTPVRKKFLKSHATEGSYISDLMEHMALSRPDVAFSFMINGNVRFHTSGNGDIREIVYRIYGRDTVKELLPFQASKEGFCVEGFLGSPSIVRSNRNFEFFFVNGRYIRSPLLSKGLEAGYKAYLMQHRFPFALLHIKVDPEEIDVNVHPSKMEIRFHDQPGIYAFLEEQVRAALRNRELIPDVKLDAGERKRQPTSAENSAKDKQAVLEEKSAGKELLRSEERPAEEIQVVSEKKPYGKAQMAPEESAAGKEHMVSEERTTGKGRSVSEESTPGKGQRIPEKRKPVEEENVRSRTEEPRPVPTQAAQPAKPGSLLAGRVPLEGKMQAGPDAQTGGEPDRSQPQQTALPSDAAAKTLPDGEQPEAPQPFEANRRSRLLREEEASYRAERFDQMELFHDKLLSRKAAESYRILGQIFGTYWLVEYDDKLLILDQHAAHEKVKYEALVHKIRTGGVDSQLLAPPMVMNLSAREMHTLTEYAPFFAKVGFEIEDFGGNAVTIRAVPCDLFGHYEKDFLQKILDELEEEPPGRTPSVIEEKLASMACKSAVKGNHRMTQQELSALLEQLMKLDNPYHCPHGRPTLITMSKYELEKKFKRIL